MIKVNEDSENKGYIGNMNNCQEMKYASITKYLNESKECNYLSQIKFFFKRNQFLIAIQNLYQNKENFGSRITGDDQYFGVLKRYNPNKAVDNDNIEEFTLSLAFGEEIYYFSGCFKDNKFIKIQIKTIYGQFFHIGDKKAEINFTFNYYYNGRFFDGFVIGYDHTKIIYLVSLIYNDKKKEEESKIFLENLHKKELIDISENVSISKYTPIYKTNVLGLINNKTIISDDIEKLGLLNDVKEEKVALNEVTVFTNGRRITRMDNTYMYIESKKSVTITHQSKSYKDSDQNYSIIVPKGGFIDHAIVYLTNHSGIVKKIILDAKGGRTLNCNNKKTNNFRELKSNEENKNLRILGMCVGREKYVQFVQFYYEIK